MKASWGLWTWGLLILFFILAPLLLVIPKGLDAAAFSQLLANTQLISSLLDSLFLAVVSAAFSTLLGTMIAFALPFYPPKVKSWITKGLVFPMVLPEIAMGISYMVWFLKCGLALGWMTLIMAHTSFCLSYATLILKTRVESLDWRLKDAARDLGARRWAVFRHALWPQIKPAMISAYLLCFCLSLDDFLISFFVKGIDQDLLPVRVFSMMRMRIQGEIYSLSVSLLCISVTVVLVTSLWQHSKQKRFSRS